jgi:hypothetical protein
MTKNMTKPVVHLVSYIAALLLACSAVNAADADSNHGAVIMFKGTPNWMLATAPSSFLTPTVMPATNLYKIYSTLGPHGETYYYSAGFAITGPKYSFGEQWVAFPFTPKADAEVTEVAAAVMYVTGTNGVTISLNEDTNGLPGKPLRTWNLTNLPTFGNCCKLDFLHSPKGVPVKKATQYWIVARTNKNTEDTGDAWDYTYNLAQGECAESNTNGKVWDSFPNCYVSAFGVFGKRLK